MEALLRKMQAQLKKAQKAKTSDQKWNELWKLLLLMKQLGTMAKDEGNEELARAVIDSMEELIKVLEIKIH
jgi:hypothetical protein